ncbi:hypothetical protein PHYPSEUDO_000686 [Phytophthora pseudosyringae]|uniref:Uncharacterized protein n=1 Tax=Phytophthora pseudosyringae TaxID=221518 RepID=A0A8T1W290_9STRA|nr:hypothetical protein PHYPSEUDO_000686 [Phytophthora pseudosyringae]
MDTSNDSPEDTRSDEKLQLSNNSEDRLRSAQEQLAELHLLARADLHSPASSFTSPSTEMMESTSALEEEGESRGRPRVATGGLSSFTAILAASRKIATSSADRTAVPSNEHASEYGVPVAPLNQVREPITVEIPGRPRSPKVSGKSLPTLNEEAEGEEDDDEDEETPETASVAVTSTSFVKKLSSSRADVVPVRQEQEADYEPDTDDFEFAEMLEHLSQGKLDFLALTPDDLTARKLKRVHAALRTAQTSTLSMPFVRTLVSVDMLQLLLRRLGARVVGDAVSRAMQHVSEREDSASGLDPIALLTSSNVAAVVLEVRHELAAAEASTVSASPPPLPRRASPASSSKHHVRRSSQTSARVCSSPSSSVSSSPRCETPRSPAADRRSILAKEGVHVLMQEKMASFEHRGQANALPAFRVRGASAALTDSAAKRRQRGLQYANEHVLHRTCSN